MAGVVTIEESGPVATVWLDRPEERNAMGADLWSELPETMESLGENPAVRVIIIASRGDHFTVGLDLKEFGAALMASFGTDAGVAGRRQTRAQVKMMQHTMTAIARCPKPVIAAVHGYCIGAGVDLITACDIRLASADALFSVRETRMGMVADVGTLQRLPRILNPGLVAELAFTGRDVTADEARDMGLVNRVFSDSEALAAGALELAVSIAANSPLAVQGSKAVLAATEHMSVDEALDYVALWNAAFLHSNDLREAVQAFLEKRPPEFDGT
ncbi:MAG: crotonase/enoyl-CoA hydratase family protein [Acidimicrobiia bacterium]|nr:crotonase/enoyl-CoA hydratase family protein [Acidimicrobiia bacterium]